MIMIMMMTEMVIARQYDHHDDNDADGDNRNVNDPGRRMHVPTAKVHSSSKIGAMRSKWNGALVELLSRRASFNAWCFSF